MAAEVLPLQQLKLPAGPSPVTAEQRYWKTFKSAKVFTSTANWPINHISFPSTSLTSASATTAARTNDLFAVTAGPRVDVYSIRRRAPLKTIGRFDSAARSGEIRPDGRVLAAGDDGGRIQVFDVAGGSRAIILKTWAQVHRQPVWAVRWAPTELTRLLSASDDKTVRLWDLPASAPVGSFVGHQDYVRAASFMPPTAGGVASGSNIVVSGSYDSTVRVWDARAPQRSVLTFKHAAPVESVLPLPSGTTVLAAAEHTISVLDLVAAKPQHLISNHQKTVTSLCLASNGQRVVSGGLDGHVKIFETTGWNVVAGMKYPSPILSVSVITAGANADDRHLAVGMQSGVLSLRTRLTAGQATRERDTAAVEATTTLAQRDALDAARQGRKRKASALQRLDALGEGADAVIADASGLGRKGGRETRWQRDLRQGRYAAALDGVLDRQAADHGGPRGVLALLLALRHRSALRAALEGRDEAAVLPLLRWAAAHVVDPRYVSVCVEMGLHLLDLYAEHTGGSAELEDAFGLLRRRVRREVERAQMATQTGGMVESLIMSAV